MLNCKFLTFCYNPLRSCNSFNCFILVKKNSILVGTVMHQVVLLPSIQGTWFKPDPGCSLCDVCMFSLHGFLPSGPISSLDPNTLVNWAILNNPIAHRRRIKGELMGTLKNSITEQTPTIERDNRCLLYGVCTLFPWPAWVFSGISSFLPHAKGIQICR